MYDSMHMQCDARAMHYSDLCMGVVIHLFY
jgi:hypothetical protein